MIQHGGSCWINKKVHNHPISPMQLECSVMMIINQLVVSCISTISSKWFLKHLVGVLCATNILHWEPFNEIR